MTVFVTVLLKIIARWLVATPRPRPPDGTCMMPLAHWQQQLKRAQGACTEGACSPWALTPTLLHSTPVAPRRMRIHSQSSATRAQKRAALKQCAFCHIEPHG